MKISRLTLTIIPIFVSVACSSSNSTPPVDGGRDARGDGAIEHEVPTDAAPTLDAPTADTAAPVDAPAEAAAPTDAHADTGGVADAGAADVPPPQRLVSTLLVVDQLPDGGVVDAGPDAAVMPTVDPHLVNPWGLAFNPAGPIWVADNGTGLSTVYDSSGTILPVVVTIPPPTGGTPPSAPTGLVFNITSGFQGDSFIFSSEGGTIAGWQSGTDAVTRVSNATGGAVYKGLALAIRDNVARLYATDFHNNKVNVFDVGYNAITTTGGFADPSLPAGFAPFGILANGSVIYVTYAKQDAMAHDDVAGAGNGYVDMFDFDGVLTRRLISQGALNSPWGLAMAPADFGTLSHSLLVGNFGDGKINAYDPTSGAFQSAAIDGTGMPVVFPGLWSLVFGNDTAGAAHNQLFFTAGGATEAHGALGRMDFVP